MLSRLLGSAIYSILVLLVCCQFHAATLHATVESPIPEAQILDCAAIRSSKAGRVPVSCDSASVQNSAVNPASRTHSSPEISNKNSTTANTLVINFNNILKTRRQVLAEAELNENCTNGQQTADVVCAPNQKQDTSRKPIRVSIVPCKSNQDQSQTDQEGNVNALALEFGSTNVVQCRFHVLEPSNITDLSFKLRWLRSVTSSQGLKSNQSILTSESERGSESATSDSNVQDHHQIFISANRIWTTQRDGGLDLLLNDAASSDSGDYFCQALSGEEIVLDERRVHISILPDKPISPGGSLDSNRTKALEYLDDDASSLYSIDNLEKLLPSLRIVPDYRELSPGDSLQLACVTSDLDPDPDPSKIEWTFEPFERPGYQPDSVHYRGAGVNSFGLPASTSQVGNLLIVWSMSHETIGIYKCSFHMDEFNLTVEASSELAMRPSIDSAPIVYMTPELLSLSANGSGRMQCESIGYPPPQLEWYRVDGSNATLAAQTKDVNGYSIDETRVQKAAQVNSIEHLEGLEVHRLESRDAMAFCLQFGCRALNNLDPSIRKQQRQQLADGDRVHKKLVTGLSWIQIGRARANHQGQYVCKASNKHGTNQASSIVDVEYKELPQVEVAEEHKLQTIVLNSTETSSTPQPPQSAAQQSVTFKCTIKRGQPKPVLKWLRTSGRDAFKSKASDFYKAANILAGHELSMMRHPSVLQSSLEIYDLTSVSSATSRVSTRVENDGRTLVLQLSTISIDDEGDYVCLGENELGRHSAAAHLVVRRPAKVRILQDSPRVFRPNDSFQLDCLVSGHPSPIDIEWSRSDRGAFFALISRHSPTLTADQERAVLKFDRVARDEAGEYTCAARDPLNPNIVLRDTIMLVVESEEQDKFSLEFSAPNVSRLLPKLLVRPTKIMAELGSNVTLDCLAVSGLQPTVVEWLAPATAITSAATGPSGGEHVSIRPYYRSPLVSLTQDEPSANLLQFGSKLRLFNVSKAHEGVYQCKGRNKVGTENAPALVEIIDDTFQSTSNLGDGTITIAQEGRQHAIGVGSAQTKTKVARMGSNIELRCQVNGIDEKPATSWSREDRELPSSSVQIDHNLWIQNLTKADEGLYLCSARSNEPNEIIQARIRLLVRQDETDARKLNGGRYNPASLNAMIVASKTHLNPGDSVTLECVISFVENNSNRSFGVSNARQSPRMSASDLSELERQVIWTNLHSGQSLFQDNVYIQNNLLIIYDLKPENSATYRCNYNDLTQSTDHKLQVGEDQTSSSSTANGTIESRLTGDRLAVDLPQNISNSQTRYILASIGSRQVLECSNDRGRRYFWTRGWGTIVQQPGASSPTTRRPVGRESEPLILDAIETHHADLYRCYQQMLPNSTQYRSEAEYLLEVQVVSAKFSQRPVSFVTLPAVSDADQQLELELKFYPENEHGLMLFSGGILNNPMATQLQPSASYSSTSNRTPTALMTTTNADFISLGLVRGHLEFRFELGDGVTLLRSVQPLEMNQWHRVLIERNRRGATMWLDGLQPYSNSSIGKFFNLNLDSMLYLGGHQIFLTMQSNASHRRNQQHFGWGSGSNHSNPANSNQIPTRLFYGFARGFQGCMSSLRINRRELNLMARNRSVSVGMFECDKPECPSRKTPKFFAFDCPQPNGLCQVDRSSLPIQQVAPNLASLSVSSSVKRRQSQPTADLRCICMPGYEGSSCRETSRKDHYLEDLSNQALSATNDQTAVKALQQSIVQTGCEQNVNCNSTGTVQCQTLSSSLHKCHCKLGYAGEQCDEVVSYGSETSIGFNRSSNVWLSFNSPQEVGSRLLAAAAAEGNKQTNEPIARLSFNETEHSKLITFTEHQNITFKMQTRASYGLLFYSGQDLAQLAGDNATHKLEGGTMQTSKSIVANLLNRLSVTKVSDFLAIALVDGHIELSYELGSGLAILRSSKRYNDGEWHRIELVRMGKSSRLLIDDSTRIETQSPGKLSMLNVGQDIHLGGLPPFALQILISTSGSSSGGSLLSAFSGCLASLHVNSLGPINLIRDDHLTSLKYAQNLIQCEVGLLLSSTKQAAPAAVASLPSDKISIDQVAATAIKPSPTTPTTQATLTFKRTTTNRPSYTTESDSDDSDELASSS